MARPLRVRTGNPRDGLEVSLERRKTLELFAQEPIRFPQHHEMSRHTLLSVYLPLMALLSLWRKSYFKILSYAALGNSRTNL